MKNLMISAMLVCLAACGGPSSVTLDEEPDAAGIAENLETPVAEPAAPIDVTGEACGGIAGIQCPSGYYCEHPVGQCLEVMDGAGTCQPMPQMCTREYRPVCGCDGTTYGNACDAAASGVSIAIEGECANPDTQ